MISLSLSVALSTRRAMNRSFPALALIILAILSALSFQVCISTLISCNPATGGTECPSSSCCGSDGYCSSAVCCTTCGSTPADPNRPPVVDYGGFTDHHGHGRRGVRWWIQLVAAAVAVLVGLVLLCWILSMCLRGFRSKRAVKNADCDCPH